MEAGSDVWSRNLEWFAFNGSSTSSSSMLNSSTHSPLPEDSHLLSGRSRRALGTVGVVVIILITSCINLLTVLGNVLVLLSIKVNRNLRTINNYFLFSLACSDLVVGAFSMNLYLVYAVKGYWPLGPQMCNLWLVVDYVVSNASVMNLLLICFDRYFCVTRPLSYPTKRTAKWAGMMIAAAWLLSLLLWAPAILLWQSGRDKSKVPEGQCYILLLANPAVTLATTIPAFYIPVVIMMVLYSRISLASQRRVCKLKSESANLLKPSKTSEGTSSANPDLVNDIKPDETCSFKQDSDLVRSKRLCSMPSVEFSKMDYSLDSSHDASAEDRGLAGETMRPKSLTGCTETSGTTQPHCFPNPTTVQVQRQTSKAISNNARRKALRERKVTKTVLAVLLAFIVTWTPYSVMVLIGTFCRWCVPEILWMVGYFLCYVNSTVNPVCYALCNATFKRTFKRLLMCKFSNLTLK
ncbi:muscarinic acetylcholine receptor M2 [Pimephales promelas]|uniref:muscarinic acetylcholine receptor M2 n=1 Tax=Pimephales promelas TaxID=90988 RepID=UPI0019559D5A|nr:muscarinic acetylcholine receptor M2 [Pimephales promelas]KAG1928927.1 muscarinic acetylcholine receptor M2 [Pimephales promelas]